MNVNEAFQSAINYYQTGNIQQAESIAKEILKVQPDNAEVLHFLGVIFYQLGNYDSSIEHIRKALELNPTDPDKYYDLANAFLEKGEVVDAINHYQKTLELNPNYTEAYNNLGLALQDNGQPEEAIERFQKALELNPDFPNAYNNLGLIYQEKQQLDKAISCYQKALEINPNYLEVLWNLGNILEQKGQFDGAIEKYQRLLNLNPSSVEVHNILGNIFYKKRQLDEAIAYYKKALTLNPDFSEIHNNLGNALFKKGLFNEAEGSYQNAINLNPNFASPHNGLGNIYKEKGQPDEALAYYQKAIDINPDFAEAYNNLGIFYKEKGQFDKAIVNFNKAIHFNPELTDSYENLGNVLKAQNKYNEAIEAYNKALSLDPNNFTARFAKCISQLPILYLDQATISISRNRYVEELKKLQDSIIFESPQHIHVASEAIGSHHPFYLAYQGFNDRDLQAMYGNLISRIMSLRYRQFVDVPDLPSPASKEPLRIGLVSGCFYLHSNWKIPIKGWIENIDKQRFRLYGYYTGVKKDQATEEARKAFSKFVEDIYSFEELCRIIREDNLHVLIYPELGMDRTSLRLAALRLAPIQCTSWGHPVTSGLPTIDYFLSSELMEPPHAEEHYTERLVRLPNLSIYYTPAEVPDLSVHRSDFGFRENSILYHCCQTLYKYLPQYDDIYPRIAKEVGDCQFIFSSHQSTSINTVFRNRIKHAFDQFHLNFEDYTVFLPFLDERHYSMLNTLSDVFLDPIGWSGCNSVFEALYFDTPVVTFPSSFMRGREGSAILTMMGMSETIASSIDEYIALAIKLGKDSDWRQYISEKIKKNKHLVYRDRACINALEDFLEKVVKEKFH